ncbi:MAG TPA: hypothetical protein VGJ60_07810 [Chloroflexota bacterium]|jgi:hypothetical protein
MTSPVLFNPHNFAIPVDIPLPEPITPVAGWYDYFDRHRDLYMAPQVYDWTCSVASTTWVLQASGLDVNAARESVAYAIGYPQCVNPQYGLMDTNCVERVFRSYGVECRTLWPNFDQMYELAERTTGLLNSTRWYHFVGIRGVSGSSIWVANSAVGYKGIGELVSRGQWDAWANSWKCVVLEP